MLILRFVKGKVFLPTVPSRSGWEIKTRNCSPLVTSCERCPLLLGSHWLFKSVVVPTVPVVSVTVTMVETLGEGELSVTFPSGLLTQFVPVVFDVRLLLQTYVIRLKNTRTKACLKLQNFTKIDIQTFFCLRFLAFWIVRECFTLISIISEQGTNKWQQINWKTWRGLEGWDEGSGIIDWGIIYHWPVWLLQTQKCTERLRYSEREMWQKQGERPEK